jgi:hypothetical protein
MYAGNEIWEEEEDKKEFNKIWPSPTPLVWQIK